MESAHPCVYSSGTPVFRMTVGLSLPSRVSKQCMNPTRRLGLRFRVRGSVLCSAWILPGDSSAACRFQAWSKLGIEASDFT